jgi:hypothetical protein
VLTRGGCIGHNDTSKGPVVCVCVCGCGAATGVNIGTVYMAFNTLTHTHSAANIRCTCCLQVKFVGFNGQAFGTLAWSLARMDVKPKPLWLQVGFLRAL